ncbi:ABC transporter permease [Cohnella lubricantis]|uniref:ABC transporter permease n=1 Tax=Cohnella lubricantis TaxID=2163172 RepID=A0A841T817_9BACL|nr:ABC transporter permease [Cohnella lubricantis]MBB6677464.1 ABC transporter permease [Cohnella lubricantis]MBP2116650.1 ABC-2 type transport system permease protein [Cohnella lubricantis]
MRALRIFWKDTLIMLRDRGTIINLFVLPLMFSSVLTLALGGVFGGGNDGGSSTIHIPIIANGEKSRMVMETIKQVEGVDWSESTLAEAKQKVEDGEILGAISLEDNPEGQVEAVYYANPAQLANSRLVYGQIQAAFSAMNDEQKNAAMTATIQSQPDLNLDDIYSQAGVGEAIGVQEEVVGGGANDVEPSSAQQYFPGFTVSFVFFIAATIAQYVFMEKDIGTMKRLLTSPTKSYAIMLGKLLPHFVVGFIQVLVIFSTGFFLFGLRLPNFGSILLVTAATVTAAVGFGLMITSLSKTQAQASGVATLFTFTLATVGGCYVPLFMMPSFMQTLAKATPQGWAMTAYQDILLKGYGILDVLPLIGVLLGFGLVFYLIGLIRFQFVSEGAH